MHISKHSLFRLKITVGCRLCAYPSIHVETPSRSRSVVWCVVWCGVLWWCVVVVVWWCCCGGVWWWCVVKLGTLSLSLSLSLALSPSFSLSLSFSLFTFFFSLLFLFLFLFLLLLHLLLLLFFLFLFFLPFYSLFSSLPFTPTNTVQSTDQQTRRPTLRRLNVMWRTVRSLQMPTNCTECSHFSSSLPLLSSLLPPSHTQKKERGLFITGYIPARNLFFITVFNIPKQ